MCVSCGCNNYEDDHGDSRNLTKSNIQEAASAAGIGVEEVASNVDQFAGNGQGQAGNDRQYAATAAGRATDTISGATQGGGNQGGSRQGFGQGQGSQRGSFGGGTGEDQRNDPMAGQAGMSRQEAKQGNAGKTGQGVGPEKGQSGKAGQRHETEGNR